MIRIRLWWILICYIGSLKCYLLCIPPLVQLSPATLLPDPERNAEWYGESWVVYPLDGRLYSLNSAEFFKAKCELSCILNQLGLDFFERKGDTGKDTGKQPSQETLRSHLINLGTWKFFLPASLSAVEIVFPFQLNLQ